MRLGLIRFKYDQSGGAERTFGLLARGLARRGHQVHVITTAWQGPPPPGVELHLGRVAARSSHGQALAWARAARQEMDRLGLDSCLALDRVPGVPVLRTSDGCHAAWLHRRAAHETPWRRLSFKINPKHRALLDLERRVFHSPDLKRIIAISHMVQRELVSYLGVEPAKITVIYNGVDEYLLAPARSPQTRRDARRALGLEPGRPVLLFLGSGFGRKGLGFIIRALVHLPEAVLLVAGRGRAAVYERLARRCAVAGRVRLLGRRDDVPQLLAAADALVLPTIYDPLSIACLEAMSVGLPVVVSAAAGAAELVTHAGIGRVVDQPADARALAGACQEGPGAGARLPVARAQPRAVAQPDHGRAGDGGRPGGAP